MLRLYQANRSADRKNLAQFFVERHVTDIRLRAQRIKDLRKEATGRCDCCDIEDLLIAESVFLSQSSNLARRCLSGIASNVAREFNNRNLSAGKYVGLFAIGKCDDS